MLGILSLTLINLTLTLTHFTSGSEIAVREHLYELKSPPKELLDSKIMLPRWREAMSPDQRFKIGGELRLEYAKYTNPIWGAIGTDPNGFFLTRMMLHTDVRIHSTVRAFVDLISAHVSGNSTPLDPPDRDELDAHQVFVDWRVEDHTIRLGRQEMEYGSGKFVSLREGKNVRSSFDGLRIISELENWRISSFYTQPTGVSPYAFDDHSNGDTKFWGIYAAHSPEQKNDLDFYYFGIFRAQAELDQGTDQELRHTLGVRYKGVRNNLFYEVEGAYQMGNFGSKSIEAWTVATQTGMHLQVAYHPRLSLTAAIASGDDDPKDNKLGTFFAMYPKGAFFGQIAQNGPSNFKSIRPSLDLFINDKWALTMDMYFFWRESSKDGVYGIPGDLIKTGQQSSHLFLGMQPGLETTYSWNDNLNFSAFYAYFFSGEFLRATPPGHDIDYTGLRATYRF